MIPYLKDSASLTGLTAQSVWGMVVAAYVWQSLFGQSTREFVITSVADSEHRAGSLHYQGNAFDLRTRDPRGIWRLADDELTLLRQQLGSALGGSYDVVIESDHMQVEWQPKKPG